MTTERFNSMSLKQKAFYPFTEQEWSSLSKGDKKRVFFARNKFKTEQK